MAKAKITLFLDTVSPFAYLAFYALENFPAFKQCEITYIPIFLGGLMKACDNRPPLVIKNKATWIDDQRRKLARRSDIPMAEKMPEGFPPNTIGVQRALVALQLERPKSFAAAQGALYHALFVENKHVEKAEVAVPIIAKAVSCSTAEAQAIWNKGNDSSVKKTLTANTDLAFKEGAFGLPWFVATSSTGKQEGFWGFDQLGRVAEHLQSDTNVTNGLKSLL